MNEKPSTSKQAILRNMLENDPTTVYPVSFEEFLQYAKNVEECVLKIMEMQGPEKYKYNYNKRHTFFPHLYKGFYESESKRKRILGIGFKFKPMPKSLKEKFLLYATKNDKSCSNMSKTKKILEIKQTSPPEQGRPKETIPFTNLANSPHIQRETSKSTKSNKFNRNTKKVEKNIPDVDTKKITSFFKALSLEKKEAQEEGTKLRKRKSDLSENNKESEIDIKRLKKTSKPDIKIEESNKNPPNFILKNSLKEKSSKENKINTESTCNKISLRKKPGPAKKAIKRVNTKTDKTRNIKRIVKSNDNSSDDSDIRSEKLDSKPSCSKKYSKIKSIPVKSKEKVRKCGPKSRTHINNDDSDNESATKIDLTDTDEDENLNSPTKSLLPKRNRLENFKNYSSELKTKKSVDQSEELNDELPMRVSEINIYNITHNSSRGVNVEEWLQTIPNPSEVDSDDTEQETEFLSYEYNFLNRPDKSNRIRLFIKYHSNLEKLEMKGVDRVTKPQEKKCRIESVFSKMTFDDFKNLINVEQFITHSSSSKDSILSKLRKRYNAFIKEEKPWPKELKVKLSALKEFLQSNGIKEEPELRDIPPRILSFEEILQNTNLKDFVCSNLKQPPKSYKNLLNLCKSQYLTCCRDGLWMNGLKFINKKSYEETKSCLDNTIALFTEPMVDVMSCNAQTPSELQNNNITEKNILLEETSQIHSYKPQSKSEKTNEEATHMDSEATHMDSEIEKILDQMLNSKDSITEISTAQNLVSSDQGISRNEHDTFASLTNINPDPTKDKDIEKILNEMFTEARKKPPTGTLSKSLKLDGLNNKTTPAQNKVKLSTEQNTTKRSMHMISGICQDKEIEKGLSEMFTQTSQATSLPAFKPIDLNELTTALSRGLLVEDSNTETRTGQIEVLSDRMATSRNLDTSKSSTKVISEMLKDKDIETHLNEMFTQVSQPSSLPDLTPISLNDLTSTLSKSLLNNINIETRPKNLLLTNQEIPLKEINPTKQLKPLPVPTPIGSNEPTSELSKKTHLCNIDSSKESSKNMQNPKSLTGNILEEMQTEESEKIDAQNEPIGTTKANISSLSAEEMQTREKFQEEAVIENVLRSKKDESQNKTRDITKSNPSSSSTEEMQTGEKIQEIAVTKETNVVQISEELQTGEANISNPAGITESNVVSTSKELQIGGAYESNATELTVTNKVLPSERLQTYEANMANATEMAILNSASTSNELQTEEAKISRSTEIITTAPKATVAEKSNSSNNEVLGRLPPSPNLFQSSGESNLKSTNSSEHLRTPEAVYVSCNHSMTFQTEENNLTLINVDKTNDTQDPFSQAEINQQETTIFTSPTQDVSVVIKQEKLSQQIARHISFDDDDSVQIIDIPPSEPIVVEDEETAPDLIELLLNRTPKRKSPIRTNNTGNITNISSLCCMESFAQAQKFPSSFTLTQSQINENNNSKNSQPTTIESHHSNEGLNDTVYLTSVKSSDMEDDTSQNAKINEINKSTVDIPQEGPVLLESDKQQSDETLFSGTSADKSYFSIPPQTIPSEIELTQRSLNRTSNQTTAVQEVAVHGGSSKNIVQNLGKTAAPLTKNQRRAIDRNDSLSNVIVQNSEKEVRPSTKEQGENFQMQIDSELNKSLVHEKITQNEVCKDNMRETERSLKEPHNLINSELIEMQERAVIASPTHYQIDMSDVIEEVKWEISDQTLLKESSVGALADRGSEKSSTQNDYDLKFSEDESSEIELLEESTDKELSISENPVNSNKLFEKNNLSKSKIQISRVLNEKPVVSDIIDVDSSFERSQELNYSKVKKELCEKNCQENTIVLTDSDEENEKYIREIRSIVNNRKSDASSLETSTKEGDKSRSKNDVSTDVELVDISDTDEVDTSEEVTVLGDLINCATVPILQNSSKICTESVTPSISAKENKISEPNVATEQSHNNQKQNKSFIDTKKYDHTLLLNDFDIRPTSLPPPLLLTEGIISQNDSQGFEMNLNYSRNVMSKDNTNSCSQNNSLLLFNKVIESNVNHSAENTHAVEKVIDQIDHLDQAQINSIFPIEKGPNTCDDLLTRIDECLEYENAGKQTSNVTDQSGVKNCTENETSTKSHSTENIVIISSQSSEVDIPSKTSSKSSTNPDEKNIYEDVPLESTSEIVNAEQISSPLPLEVEKLSHDVEINTSLENCTQNTDSSHCLKVTSEIRIDSMHKLFESKSNISSKESSTTYEFPTTFGDYETSTVGKEIPLEAQNKRQESLNTKNTRKRRASITEFEKDIEKPSKLLYRANRSSPINIPTSQKSQDVVPRASTEPINYETPNVINGVLSGNNVVETETLPAIDTPQEMFISEEQQLSAQNQISYRIPAILPMATIENMQNNAIVNTPPFFDNEEESDTPVDFPLLVERRVLKHFLNQVLPQKVFAFHAQVEIKLSACTEPTVEEKQLQSENSISNKLPKHHQNSALQKVVLSSTTNHQDALLSPTINRCDFNEQLVMDSLKAAAIAVPDDVQPISNKKLIETNKNQLEVISNSKSQTIENNFPTASTPRKRKFTPTKRRKRKPSENDFVPQKTHAFRSLPLAGYKKKPIETSTQSTLLEENDECNYNIEDVSQPPASSTASQILGTDITYFEDSQLLKKLDNCNIQKPSTEPKVNFLQNVIMSEGVTPRKVWQVHLQWKNRQKMSIEVQFSVNKHSFTVCDESAKLLFNFTPSTWSHILRILREIDRYEYKKIISKNCTKVTPLHKVLHYLFDSATQIVDIKLINDSFNPYANCQKANPVYRKPFQCLTKGISEDVLKQMKTLKENLQNNNSLVEKIE